ncbi:MAG: protein kinase [Planctomycetes bacterium]|nr:protein kinase [Planctomycetota bacterium]MCW8136739.1 protein kinase [Planctomycetota bacterium]
MGQSAPNDSDPAGERTSSPGNAAASEGWRLADSTPTGTILNLGASDTPITDNDPAGLAGVKLGELLIERRLGAGGMGEVWLGRDTELDIPVAIKVLPARLAEDANFVIRFQREARAVAKLDHPNIVRVLQAGRREHRGRYLRLMVMELVDGVDLARTLQSSGGKLEPRAAANLTLQAAYALRYAHGKGVVHRDIKPANLLVPADSKGPAVKVLDFGLALLTATVAPDGAEKNTRTGAVMGTPLYMSPEQAVGKHLDARTDVYSLGITLYEMLAGRTPYDADSTFSIIKGHVEMPLEFPREHFGALPPLFEQLIRGMCAKQADDRLPLKHVIEQLENFLDVSHASTPATPAGPRTNIQLAPTSFVGREREMAELARRLREGAKLVTVLGPGGIGKTRFTQEFGLWVAQDYPAGVWFCDLTEARTEAGICHGVGTGMGIPLTQENPITQIHAALRLRGRMLIILDNFEQVTQHAAATLGLWLKDTPEVQFVATSREPLHLAGEKSFPLDALSVAEADDAPAIQLFCDRASDVRRDFKLDAGNQDAVKRIVQELDGIPLAIELAAARVASMPPQKILERLPKRFDLLTSRRRDASAKQATLRAAIDWSWELLAPWEKLALAQCSVFRDGFFLEAAEAVLDLSAFPEAPMVIDVIENLAEKSLLKAYEVPSLPGEARFRMYESIREYAEWKMMDPNAVPGHTGEEGAKALRLRHGRFYSEYVGFWNTDGRVDAGQQVAHRRIELDLLNLFAAQDFLESVHPHSAAHIALHIENLLESRGPFDCCIPRLERAASSLENEVSRLRVEVLRMLSWAYFRDGRSGLMVQRANAALAVAKGLPETDSDKNARVASALLSYGRALSHIGSQEEALKCYSEAESVGRGYIDRDSSLHCYRGVALRKLGRVKDALRSWDKGEPMARSDRDWGGVSVFLMHRGEVELEANRWDAALRCFNEAKELMQREGNLRGIANALDGIAWVHERRGELDLAIQALAEEQMNIRQVGMPKQEAYALARRAKLLGFSGRFDEALSCFTAASEIWRKIGEPESIAYADASRAWCLTGLGRFEQSLDVAKAADALAQAAGAHRQLCYARLCLAKAMYGLWAEDSSTALSRLGQIAETLRELGTLQVQLAKSEFDPDATFERMAIEARVNWRLAKVSASSSGSDSESTKRQLAHEASVVAARLAAEARRFADDHGIEVNHINPDVRAAFGYIEEVTSGQRV